TRPQTGGAGRARGRDRLARRPKRGPAVIILDTLLIGGLKFVLNKIVDAVDSQLNDDGVVREELLAAQMRLELGEISEKEFATLEADLLARLREIRERQRGAASARPRPRRRRRWPRPSAGDVSCSSPPIPPTRSATPSSVGCPRARLACRLDAVRSPPSSWTPIGRSSAGSPRAGVRCARLPRAARTWTRTTSIACWRSRCPASTS